MTGFVAPQFGDLSWMSEGLCADRDSAVFFPERGETWKVVAAKRVCMTPCPVRDECLAFALDNHEQFGVWGGATVMERRKLRKERNAGMVAEGLKRCARCRAWKPLARFHRMSDTGDGLHPRCRDCRSTADPAMKAA